jgi:uncharacterized protein (TIGR03118 family)
MKKIIKTTGLLAAFAAITCFYACHKDHDVTPPLNPNLNQTVLVADTTGLGTTKIDAKLGNAWGIAIGPTGGIWISANHTGVSTVYDNTGQTIIPPVTIPAAKPTDVGAPTGVVFNSTKDFAGSKFIFAGEDGIIAAWTSGSSAVKVADRSLTNAVYKGIALAADGSTNFLYVTNFKGSKIDVFDSNFNYVSSKPFHDPGIPADYGPFNIANIGGKLYVTYAKHKGPDNEDDQAGAGNGYVDIFNPDGTLVKRFASQGALNSPWGITIAPAGFADFGPTILVGNFGDGRINVFDQAGNYKGQLHSSASVITIHGLWAIDFLKGNGGIDPGDPLYFTAGPDDESHGVFGILQK